MLGQTTRKIISVGSIPTDRHPQVALLQWGPDSVEYNAEITGSNQTAVQAYRQAYDAGDLDGCLQAYYTLQTAYYSPETGLDAEGRSIYETIKEDTRRNVRDYGGLEDFASLLALFPAPAQEAATSNEASLRVLIQRLHNERERHEKSWKYRLKKKLRAVLGDEEDD